MAQKVFLKLYTNRRTKKSFLGNFFKNELPSIIYASRKEMLVCFLVFLLTFTVGVFSSIKNPGFSRQILGDDYVEMTTENIEEGNPMDVYAHGNRFNSFLRIAYNNLRVDMLTFATGLLFALGTLFILAYNGVMVGVFQYFFYGTGYFTFTVLTIWLHGTLEIFTIILSSTAGLVFGKGLIFPGTYSRSQAFRISAIKGVKIIFAVFPLTLFAAFIEAFITGQTDAPLYLKAALILCSLIAILFYFVYYPYKKFAGTSHSIEQTELPPYNPPKLILTEIKTIGEVISDTFRVWRFNLKQIILFSLFTAFGIVLFTYFSENQQIEYQFFNQSRNIFTLIPLLKINLWFRDSYYEFWYVILGLLALFTTYFQVLFIKKHVWNTAKTSYRVIKVSGVILINSSSLLFFYFMDGFQYFLLFYFLLFPFSITINIGLLSKGLNGISKGFNYFFIAIFPKLLLNLILLIIIFIFYLLASSPIVHFIIESLSSGLKVSDYTILQIEKIIVLTIGLTSLLITIPLYLFAQSIHYFSINEKMTAEGLRQNLEPVWKS